MSSNAIKTEAILKRPIEYPFKNIPIPGSAIQVAPSVFWLRMPMPLALTHINLWAIDDIDGWTIVDTGLWNSETVAIWSTLLAGPLQNRPITRVIVTHMHPDHIGMAGWLTRKFGCRLWMTRLEYLMARVMVSDMERTVPNDAVRFYHAAGWSEAALENYKSRFGEFGNSIMTLPESYRRINDGENVIIGGRTWHVVVGTGHSPEHAALYCPELEVLISGDQVLPRISSNVSVDPSEPDAIPVSDWLKSITKISATIPDGVLVLPSHNEPFYGLHRRLCTLASDMEESLNRLYAFLQEPRRVVDVFSVLFRRQVNFFSIELNFATGEAQALINELIFRGDVTMEYDDKGVAWYRQQH